jgi:hypothetical protein
MSGEQATENHNQIGRLHAGLERLEELVLELSGVRRSLANGLNNINESETGSVTIEEAAVVIDAMQTWEFPDKVTDVLENSRFIGNLTRCLQPRVPYAIVHSDRMSTVVTAGIPDDPMLTSEVRRRRAWIRYEDQSGNRGVIADGRRAPDSETLFPTLRLFFGNKSIETGGPDDPYRARTIHPHKHTLLVGNEQLRSSAAAALEDAAAAEPALATTTLSLNMQQLVQARYGPASFMEVLATLDRTQQETVRSNVMKQMVKSEEAFRTYAPREQAESTYTRHRLHVTSQYPHLFILFPGMIDQVDEQVAPYRWDKSN